MSKKAYTLKRNDIILIVCLLLAAAIGLIYLFLLRSSGNTVKVTVDGKLYGTYSLSENRTEDIISGENKQFHNRLVIKDNKAYIESASCPDGICVAHRPIHRNGESIICLPNKVVVTVVSNGSADIDIIA